MNAVAARTRRTKMDRYKDIEEVTMSGILAMREEATGNEAFDNMRDNALIAMSAMSKTMFDAKELDLDRNTISKFMMVVEMWYQLCRATISENAP
jgi:hypothetical protein